MLASVEDDFGFLIWGTPHISDPKEYKQTPAAVKATHKGKGSMKKPQGPNKKGGFF
jgi:hypothetical protein